MKLYATVKIILSQPEIQGYLFMTGMAAQLLDNTARGIIKAFLELYPETGGKPNIPCVLCFRGRSDDVALQLFKDHGISDSPWVEVLGRHQTEKSVAEAFDQLYKKWKKETKVIQKMVAGFDPGTVILDVPLGTGRFLPIYRSKEIQTIGLDISADMLKQAKNKMEKTERTQMIIGDAQHIPLRSDTVDLIVTSPPYASNAIDYMRAHKFSLVWLGYPINTLSDKRKEYIGGEMVSQFQFEQLPDYAARIVSEITDLDAKKGAVLHRYYSEMTRVLKEMYRVLRPGKASIMVVGSSIMRGIDTRTEASLAEIGRAVGFEVPAIGVRELDRNRRMMPAGSKLDLESQIQQRMHEEYVIGFYKPET